MGAEEDSNKSDSVKIKTQIDTQEYLAIIVVTASLYIIFILSLLTFYCKGQSSKEILNVLLPVLGTWVGVVLAYYFSKSNFESAQRTIDSLTDKLTPDEKIKKITVLSVMMDRNKMYYKKWSELKDNLLLTDVLFLLDENKNSRLPIFEDDFTAKYLIHRRMLDKFIADSVLKEGKDPKTLTFDDLLKNDEIKAMIESNYGFVSKSSNLSDAKRVMIDEMEKCSDVFVTENGKSTEEVIGWITDNIITEKGKL
ncbi:hypothetical protein MCHI_003870 [Candidatus Magnetoovum chiemensis]|nr:hypothetical protein MCHI_003870 [Candidatus Magnetoovum chiemensis]